MGMVYMIWRTMSGSFVLTGIMETTTAIHQLRTLIGPDAGRLIGEDHAECYKGVPGTALLAPCLLLSVVFQFRMRDTTSPAFAVYQNYPNNFCCGSFLRPFPGRHIRNYSRRKFSPQGARLAGLMRTFLVKSEDMLSSFG